MMRKNTIAVILLFAILLGTATTAYAYSEATVNRPHLGYEISDATNNTPLVEFTEYGPYYGGTTDQQFITITNHYDEPVTVNFQLSQNNWEFSSTGTRTTSVTIQPNESQTTAVSIGGASKTCDQQQNTWSYTYNVDSSTLNIQDSTNNVTICGGPGGGGNGGGGNNGGGNGGGPP